MNVEEAAMLCRFVKAATPSQKMDDDTPTAWALLMDDLSYGDALTAAREFLKVESYIEPKDIRRGVRKVRADRLIAFGDFPTPPPECADGPEYHEWRGRTQQAIADGRYTRDMIPVEPKGRRAPALDHIFQKVSSV